MIISGELERKRSCLIEKIGHYLESQDKLAPLAARLYATLILTGKKGITFEKLVKDLNASKSSVCTHLHTLQANNMAGYFTKPGDRKKYFIVAPNRLIKVIEEMTAAWKDEKDIQEDILEFKRTVNEKNPADPEFDLEYHTNYLTFLSEASHSISNLKKNILTNYPSSNE